MEDTLEHFDDSSSAHSHININTLPASRFLNLGDPGNPFRLDNGDNPAVILVTDLLTTDNYATWSRAMRRALRAKNKLGFISGAIPQPIDPEDPLLELWERCNDMVVSWIQNSISPSIKSSVVFVDDAREIWLDLQDRFSQQNEPRIFQLKKTLSSLLQDNDSVSIYYSKLKTFWDELSIYDPIPACNCGSMKTLLDRYQRDCVFQFLKDLRDSYANVRDQIMLLDPLPSVTKVFSLIHQQEQQHNLISTIPSLDLMALAIKKTYPNTKFSAQPRPPFKKDRPYCSHCKILGHSLESCFKAGHAEAPVCTHCHLPGHIVDKCYKLHGYPPGHKFFSKSQSSGVFANQFSLSNASEPKEISDERVGLTRTQYQQLIALLQPRESSTAAPHSANQIQSIFNPSSPSNISGIPFCFSTYTHKLTDTPWIIDTGAIDHMVCCTSFLTTITKQVSLSVKLLNGNQVLVTHTGNVQLTKSILLKDVLCVPSFHFNLLLAKKLATSLTCCLVFFSDYCFIQDLLTWTTIGKGEVRHGLYHLLQTEVAPSTLATILSNFFKTNVPVSASVINNVAISDLWHCRLGHLSLSRLLLITDPIVKQHTSSTNEKSCCICPLAKLHKLHFPDSTHKTLRPFELIHCDLWGPCSTAAYDGSKYFLTIVDDFIRTT
ncbi:hypothetical protein F2P56_034581 [Juglans regia]|uniref:Uncharacterized protein LOC108993052 n=2 Tax=Juglans regia TaxID=51240 RepID=A0A2I4EVD4_JUGRE|nr:uncharacterized protein LOC108993052 [Juglans regia]KAF5445535.1 hypothetical protein F2P56_034581 [Juglans regia]